MEPILKIIVMKDLGFENQVEPVWKDLRIMVGVPLSCNGTAGHYTNKKLELLVATVKLITRTLIM